MITNPKHYNLNSRTQLLQVSDKEITIVKRSKSRLIRNDAEKIMTMVGQIEALDTELKVSLICNDAICSKSLTYLDENGVELRIDSRD